MLERGDVDHPGSGYTSRFSHADEIAQPGYYAVTLDDYGVRAELTASARVGVHRYTFPKGKPAHVLIDLRTSLYDYPGKVLWSRLRLRGDGTVTGFRETRGWAPGRQLYFAMRFSRAGERPPVPRHRTGRRLQGLSAAGARRSGAARADRGPAAGRRVRLRRCARCAVAGEGGDLAGQRRQRHRQPRCRSARLGFRPRARRRTHAVDAGARARSTSMRRHRCAPVSTPRCTTHCRRRACSWTATAVIAGRTTPCTRRMASRNYSTFSLWDTYRALHPLLTLLQPPQRTNDIVNSLLAARRESPYGILPVWAFQGQETWCMIGYHAVPVIADAYMKGIRGYDADEALQAMVASASYGPYDGLAQYMQLGYVPIDEEDEAASKTLEYAFDDWTIARMAGRHGSPRHCRALRHARRQLEARLRSGHRLHARAQARRQLPRALRSGRQRLRQRLHRRQRMAVLVVRAAGRRRAWRRRWAATTRCWRSSTRCSTRRSIRRSSRTWKTSPA